MRVLITDTMYCTEAGRRTAFKIGEQLGEVIVNPLNRKLTGPEIEELWQDVDVIIAGTEIYDAGLLKRAPERLKMIARNGVTCENIDLTAAAEKGIAVTVVRGANARAVADGTMALMLAVARHLPETDRLVRDGIWQGCVADDIYNKTLGILGFGAVGKEVAKRALGFGMKVLAYSPAAEFDEEFAAKYSIQRSDMDEILEQSDFVTLHMPAVPSTVNIIDKHALSKMKPSAYLINTARGALVKEEDLYEALKNGVIRGAGLDVFQKEPLGKSSLLTLKNVVLSPHCAGLSVNAIEEMGRLNTEHIRAVSQGMPCSALMAGPFRKQWK